MRLIFPPSFEYARDMGPLISSGFTFGAGWWKTFQSECLLAVFLLILEQDNHHYGSHHPDFFVYTVAMRLPSIL